MPFSEADFESPGFEYLRLYQNMSNLYSKLVALNYRSQFCGVYKCPPIHRHYFAVASSNSAEQRFIFTCLCAWLIKDKCQMNFRLEPQEYENLDDTLATIREAMQLLLLDSADTNEQLDEQVTGSNSQRFSLAISRLAEGHGPEVIWTLNTFADRALQVASHEQGDQTFRVLYGPQIVSGESSTTTTASTANGSTDNKTSSNQANTVVGANQPNFITIGQPFVGGGLTTRPLGSYKVDDFSLVFTDENDSSEFSPLAVNCEVGRQEELTNSLVDSNTWYNQVEQSRDALESMRKAPSEAILIDGKPAEADWDSQLKILTSVAGVLAEFKRHSGPILAQGAVSLAGQLEAISERENILKEKLGEDLEDYLRLMRRETTLTRRRDELSVKVEQSTGRFERLNQELAENEAEIRQRIVELNDGSRLSQLKSVISRMEQESQRMDLEIGLLLTVYARRHDQAETI